MTSVDGVGWHTGVVSMADELLEQRRLRRRAGDPRVTEKGRQLMLRLTRGDLAEEFARSLEEVSDADPLLSGRDDLDD